MFQEQIAKLTSDHLRTHIAAYLIEINAQFNDGTNLTVPKSIEPASVVGGIFTEFDNILPQYGIDITDKSFAPDGGDLFTFLYVGQINGLVHTQSRDSVDKLIKRHEAACELFIRRHQFFHETSGTNYRLLEMLFDNVEFSGAEELPENEGREQWMAGFSINLSWLTSEDGPGQHA